MVIKSFSQEGNISSSLIGYMNNISV